VPGACCIRLRTTPEGLAAAIEPFEAVDFDSGVESFGPFRSERDAERALEGKAREAGLCLKVMGLERGEGSCFAYQIGKCRGACVGREPRPLHDTRMRLALASLRVKAWPFPGPVGIREAAAGGAGTVLHVVDRWQHLGTARDDDEVAGLLRSTGEGGFDPDSYRIVARCLEGVAPRDLVLFERRGG
jgi:DNA polymerase-3 subunit epsilon